jgi:hypothetical protein
MKKWERWSSGNCSIFIFYIAAHLCGTGYKSKLILEQEPCHEAITV